MYLQKDNTSGDTSHKNCYKNSHRYQGSKIWNELPNDIKNATDHNLFKNLITNWNGKLVTVIYVLNLLHYMYRPNYKSDSCMCV